ncbi:MAG: MBOAT family protein [Candidatus Pseudobacter hemicellulosilyticus]|uniref:MBOAT family protein n=1 Tax=Candidatus Pseudobacter hemicellulosilyticus TaxID=3121375 RepID=A0AAJ5WUH6_9BACT|nr:MAG: MBOAT family protein [Pseudobacter sp.]
MLFNSIDFLIFFVFVTTLYFALPHRFRWLMLLIASCFFYMMFKPEYILILGFTIVIDYYAGIKIEEAKDAGTRKRYLVLSLIANIGVLAVFKYFNFINDNITGLANLFGYNNHIPYLKIILPIGLSFHTFQAMSYTIEVYRGNQKAERHFGIYSLYVMFYPQLVAGPIERPQNMLHQFWTKYTWDYDRVMSGLRLMGWGLFKKVVVADRLSIVVDAMYSGQYGYDTIWVFIGTFFFAYQIYCDFSGYSDIALGSARVMGFTLMKNFNYPFQAKTITDYWRRWHISLSTWFSDYLYTPIVINKRDWAKWAVVYGLIITFFISGLWHGAGWPFIIWGVLHGVAMSYEFMTKKWRKKTMGKLPLWLNNRLSQLMVFAFLQFVWIFFRAESFTMAFNAIKGIFNYENFINTFQSFTAALKYSLLVGGMVLIIFLVLEKLWRDEKFQAKLNNSVYGKYAAYALMFLVFIFFGSFKNAQSFIYFQF